MFNIYGGATEFNQWDLDQFVTNDCMKAGDEVVFRNASGETYVVKAFEQNGEVLADVPNYLLKKAKNILVDLEQGADKHDDCRTVFTVVAQDEPDGYDCKYNVPDRSADIGGGSGGSGGSGGGATVITLYCLSVYEGSLWTNPDDVGDESKKLVYDDAVNLVDADIVRVRLSYGNVEITFICLQVSHHAEGKGVVELTLDNGTVIGIRP